MFVSRFSIRTLLVLGLLLCGAATLSAQPAYRAKQDRLIGQSREEEGKKKSINIFKPESLENYTGKARPNAEMLDSISTAFRPGGRRSSLGQYISLFVLITLVGVAIWYYNRQATVRGHQSGYDDPGELFQELCEIHQVDRMDRKFLRTFAKKVALENMLMLFVEPRFFDAALVEPLFSHDFPTLLRLRTKFFGPLDPSHSEGTIKSGYRPESQAHSHELPSDFRESGGLGKFDDSEKSGQDMSTMLYPGSGVSNAPIPIKRESAEPAGKSSFSASPGAHVSAVRNPQGARETARHQPDSPTGPPEMSLVKQRGVDWLQPQGIENIERACENISKRVTDRLAEMVQGIPDWWRRNVGSIGKRLSGGNGKRSRSLRTDTISYRPASESRDAASLLAVCDPEMLDSQFVARITDEESITEQERIAPDFPDDIALMERLLAE